MKRFPIAVLAVLLASAPAARAAAPLVADLSSHLVAITTGFSGAQVLLFGAIEEVAGASGGDVVVVVRGPARPETLRRKARTAGMWINSGVARVSGAPSFYQVAATRPLDEIAAPDVLERHKIGLDHLDMEIGVEDDGADAATYRQALIRLKQAKGLYGSRVQPIAMLSRRLFRTDVAFPADVPVGTYMVEVYLLADHEVVGTQTTPLVVGKIGLGADIFDFAHHQAAAYGVGAVVLAGLSGWLAAVALKKG